MSTPPRPPQIIPKFGSPSRSPRPAIHKPNDDDDDAKKEDDDRNGGGDGDGYGGPDLPMTMSASVILTNLPRDASQALKGVEEMDLGKVTIRFKPVGSAPILRALVFKLSASSKFEVVVKFLRKKLDCKPADSVFLYVNSVFAPGLDEGVGNLFRCFKTDDQLIVAYSMTPAFG